VELTGAQSTPLRDELSLKGELTRVRFNDWLARRDHTSWISVESRAGSETIQAAAGPGNNPQLFAKVSAAR